MCSTPVTMRISSIPAAVSLRTGWKIIGSRPTGSRCLLVTLVSGNRREPVPPARTIPFIVAPSTARVVPEMRRKAKKDRRKSPAVTSSKT
jgi:hypothetical protein